VTKAQTLNGMCYSQKLSVAVTIAAVELAVSLVAKGLPRSTKAVSHGCQEHVDNQAYCEKVINAQAQCCEFPTRIVLCGCLLVLGPQAYDVL